MAEQSAEVLLLRDGEGNLYALPRQMVERARVPDELKGTAQMLHQGRMRQWLAASAASSPAGVGTIAAPNLITRFSRPDLPWPIGWVRTA